MSYFFYNLGNEYAVSGRFSNIFGTAYRKRMKILGHHGWDVQLTKRQYVPTNTHLMREPH